MSAGKNLFIGVLLLGVAGGYLYYEKPELLRKYLPKQFVKYLPQKAKVPIAGFKKQLLLAQDWEAPDQAKQKLQSMIDKGLMGTSAADVQAFLNNSENALALNDATLLYAQDQARETEKKLYDGRKETLDKLSAELEASQKAGVPLSERAEVANRKKAARIAAIQEELSLPATIEDLAKDPDFARILTAVTKDLKWTDQIANSGETAPTGEVISTLALLAKTGKVDLFYNEVERDIATATALEFARSGWSKQDAVERAIFHVNAWRSGKMNKGFASLPFWQKRMVCGLKGKGLVDGGRGNDSAGSVRSLSFSQKNVHLPAYRYTGACWQAPYRLNNIYGDIIHNADRYYSPFQDTLLEQFNSATRYVGGVCGGLSHYGATSAVANGVPATTAGEPAHCSYIVRVGDKWVPSYSLSWQRGLHWQIFQGNNKYSALHMADNLFSDVQMPKTRESQAMRNLANLYSGSDPAKAETLYRGAVQTQPLNYYAWRDYANFLSAEPQGNAQKLVDFCKLVNSSLAGTYPEMAATLLRSHVFPALQKAANIDKASLQETLADFWKQVQLMGPDPEWDKGFSGRWDVEGLLDEQAKLLGINMQKDAKGADFMRTVLGKASDKTAYATAMLSWGNTLYEKMDPKLQSNFLSAMIQGATGGSSTSDAEREKMLNNVILAAEKSGDIVSFNAIAKSLPSSYTNPARKIPAPTPFSGKLVSQGGIILASSTSQFDKPCAHWGVLEPGVGGIFHTGKDQDAWVRVTLPKQANLTGIVICTTSPNLFNRLNNMVVQVSETGNDNDWHDVAQLGPCKQDVLRVDLSGSHPLAKYVRILRKGGPEFFHLFGIYVYGKPAA